jgi:O-antigen ligase
MQRNDSQPLIPAAAAVLSAVSASVLALLVVNHPDFLHVEVSARALAALAGALLGAGLLVMRPGIGIVILVALVYLNLSTLLVRFQALPSLLQLLGVPLVLAAWLAQGTRRLTHTLAPTPLLLAMVAFLAALLSSSVAAQDHALANERLLEYGRALAVALLVPVLAWDRALIRRGAWVLLSAAALLGLIAIYQAATGTFETVFSGLGRVKYAQIYADVFRPRIAGPVGDPNFFALMLIPAVALGAVLAGHEPDRRLRYAALTCSACAAAGVFLSYSRGGLLALAVVAAGVVRANAIPLRRVAVAGAAVLALALTQSSALLERLSTFREFLPGNTEVVSDPDSSFEERRVLGLAAWHMFRDHPLLGVGTGNYTRHYDDYASRSGAQFRLYGDGSDRHYPHNFYLEAAAEAGLIGVAALVVLLVVCAGVLRRAGVVVAAAGDRALLGIAQGLLVGLTGYLVAAIFLHDQFPRPLWLLFGLTYALERVVADGAAGSGGPADPAPAGPGAPPPDVRAQAQNQTGAGPAW